MERQETGLVTELTEAETSLKEGHRDWASLPFPVIECVVRVLKGTRRWRLEGRSLRLLNRHWSAAINIHVEEIRSDATRTIVDEDIASLSKFEGVTSIDISPFLILPPELTLRINCKKKEYLRNWYDTMLERIVDVLSQLPKLMQIEIKISVETMVIFRRSRSAAQEQFSRLEKITSAYLYGKENLKRYGKTHLNTTHTWLHNKESKQDYPIILAQLLGSLKRLESLEVEWSALKHCKQFEFLDEVKNLILHGVDFRMLTRLPNPSTTVSSAVVPMNDGFAPDPLVHLNCLHGLSIKWSPQQDNLIPLSRSRGAEYLKVLTISEHWWEADWRAIPNEAFGKFKQLECLSMRSCCFDGALLGEKLPNLKALRIEFCTVLDGIATFVSQFRELELLCWQSVFTTYYLEEPMQEALKPLSLPWEKMTSLNLRSLSVVPVLDDSELIFISRQTNLEVLHIGSDYFSYNGYVADKWMHVLEKLPNLRILQVQFLEIAQRRIWSALLSSNMVTRLEQLWLQCHNVYEEDEQILEDIRRRSPHIILKVGRWNTNCFLMFDRACFI